MRVGPTDGICVLIEPPRHERPPRPFPLALGGTASVCEAEGPWEPAPSLQSCGQCPQSS